MGTRFTNLFTNPSAETNLTNYTANGSTLTNPVVGGGYGSRIVRATSTVAAGFGAYSNLAALPTVVPGRVYTAGINFLALPATRSARIVIEWRDSGGILSTLSGSSTPALGWRTVQGVAPVGADRALIGFSTVGGAIGEVIDADGLSLIDGNWTSYFDGDTPGAAWLGTAHASASSFLVPSIDGVAINTFWQGGWFTYGTPLVKTIRELKLSGSGLVTVGLAHDYRQLSSVSEQRELSPPVGFYDTGLLYDSGLRYGPANIVQPKAIRKAIRGESFSLRLSNSTINRTFKVHRLTTHVRDTRVPSVVKVS
jgi:hypothetical protein